MINYNPYKIKANQSCMRPIFYITRTHQPSFWFVTTFICLLYPQLYHHMTIGLRPGVWNIWSEGFRLISMVSSIEILLNLGLSLTKPSGDSEIGTWQDNNTLIIHLVQASKYSAFHQKGSVSQKAKEVTGQTNCPNGQPLNIKLQWEQTLAEYFLARLNCFSNLEM